MGATNAAHGDSRVRLRDETGRRWRAAQVAARRRHAGERALPDLLVLGAQRGGTTTLYRWLAAHPQVHAPLDKEIQFFSLEWSRGIDWYRCHFGRVADGLVNFEASPYYLYHPSAPARAASVVPKARFVALLRDPVARAWSHYHHNFRRGLERLSFADAIAAEEARLAGEAARLEADPLAVSLAHRHHSYVDRGRYAPQVSRWRSRAGDRLLVLSSEQLFAEPHRTFQRLLEFVELDPWRPPSYVNASPKHDTPPMPSRQRDELRELFAHGDGSLISLVDFDPASWAA